MIPAFDEADRIVRSVESAVAPGVEVVVVDGGSRDATVRLASAAGARILCCERGRALQLRRGGERATGEAVVFLHADTVLPAGWVEAVRGALSDPGCAGGAFALRFAERGPRERWIEGWVALRNALLRLPYGDQALFVRRAVLERAGGVPQVPLMEDLDLVRIIKQHGRLVVLTQPALTSPRRYLRSGVASTALRHVAAAVGYELGVDRARLARWVRR